MNKGRSQPQTTTTQVQNTEPSKMVQPYLNKSLVEATRFYDGRSGTGIFPGQTYVDQSANTQAAKDGMLSTALGSKESAAAPYSEISANIAQLGPAARGDFSGDTAFNNMLSEAQDATSHAVNMGASAAGRYGSATHHGAIARELGNVTNNAMLQRQNDAQQGLLASTEMLPAAYQTQMLPYQTQMDVGAMDEDMEALKLQDEIDKFNQEQNKEWDLLAKYNAMISGAGSLGGSSSTTTATRPAAAKPNPFLQGLGILAGGASLFR